MQILYGFAQMLLGAAAGYYTNKLAITHLFSDIPLPGGSWRAVIKKGGNKERLAEDLSRIAQDKIFGKKEGEQLSYLEKELSKKEVSESLDRLVDALFKRLAQMDNEKVLLSDALKELLSCLKAEDLIEAEAAMPTLCLGDFVSEESFVDFCSKLWTEKLFSGLSVDNGSRISHFIEGAGFSYGEILGEQACDSVRLAVSDKMREFAVSMQNSTQRLKMEGYLYPFLRYLGIFAAVRELLQRLREKTLGELLPVQWKEQGFGKILKFCEQGEIFGCLKDIFSQIMEKISQSELTVADLLPEGCLEEEALWDAVGEGIAGLEACIMEFYEKNEDIIRERLRLELSDVIDEGTGNFLQNMVLFGAKDMILQKMEQYLKEKFPDTISEFVKHPSKELCRSLCQHIGELSLSGVADYITFETLWEQIKSSEQIASYAADWICGMSLSVFLTDSVVDSVSKRAEEKLLESVSEWLSDGDKMAALAQKTVDSLFKRKAGEKEVEWLLKKADEKKEAAFSALYKKFRSISVKELFSKALSSGILEGLTERVSVKTLISLVPREAVKKKARELFVGHAGSYLHIRPLVKEKVLSLDEDTLCAMMQKFMGTQLRPLNVLGGVLGAAAGLLMAFIMPGGINIPFVLLSVLCYALVGIGTNVLALRGLFRPYHLKERKFLSSMEKKGTACSRALLSFYHLTGKIPVIKNLCYLGYIPEKKEMIARELGKFMANNFLRPEELLPKVTFTTEQAVDFVKKYGKEAAYAASGALLKAVQNQGEERERSNANQVFSFLTSEKTIDGAVRLFRELDISGGVKLLEPIFKQIGGQKVSYYFPAENITPVITQFLLNLPKDDKVLEWSGQMAALWYEQEGKNKSLGLLVNQEAISQKLLPAVYTVLYGREWRIKGCAVLQKAVWARAADTQQRVVTLFGDKAETMLHQHKEKILQWFLSCLSDMLHRYMKEHEEELVDKLNDEIGKMIDEMGDTSGVGGLATSMLGIRQIIAKVYRRTFMDTPVFQEGTEEAQTENSLIGVLIRENERELLEKFREIFDTRLLTATVGDVRGLLFAAEKRSQESEGVTVKRIGTWEEMIYAWIERIADKGFALFDQCREENEEAIQHLAQVLYGQLSQKNLEVLAMSPAWKELFPQMLLSVRDSLVLACQKQNVQSACAEWMQYVWQQYVGMDMLDRYMQPVFDHAQEIGSVIFKKFCEWDEFPKLLRETIVFAMEQISLQDYLYKDVHVDGHINVRIKEELTALFSYIFARAADLAGQTGSMHKMFEALLYEGEYLFLPENKEGAAAIVSEIDFSEIIRKAVLDMEDAQVEALFQGFAGQYFSSLKLSGALGFVFGIPGVQYAAVLAALLGSIAGHNKEEIKI